MSAVGSPREALAPRGTTARARAAALALLPHASDYASLRRTWRGDLIAGVPGRVYLRAGEGGHRASCGRAW